MSITTAPGTAEASSSSASAPATGIKMPAGQEETKEERKARKAAKRAAKAAQVDAEPTAAIVDSAQEAGPSSTSTPVAPTAAAETISVIEKKSKKDKKRKRAEGESGAVAESEAPSGDAAVETKSAAPEVVNPLDEKRARKAARKATKAAASAAAVGGPPPADTVLVAAEPISTEAAESETARKALEYVKSHAASLSSDGSTSAVWKFNKANQNWLLRNVWNESEVPEEDVDGVMRYLNTIKGGGRKALIDMAEKCLAAGTAEPSDPTPAASVDASATAPTAAVAAITAVSTPIISPEEAKRDQEVIKGRAEKLLLLLRA